MPKIKGEFLDKLIVTDDIQIVHTIGSPSDPPVVRNAYVVTDSVKRPTLVDQHGNLISNGSNGIFKNGKLHKPGDEIKLDARTAAAFLELGQIEVKK